MRRTKTTRSRSQPTTDATTAYSYIPSPQACSGIAELPTPDTSLPLCLRAGQRPPNYEDICNETSTLITTTNTSRQASFRWISFRFQSLRRAPSAAKTKTSSIKSRCRRSIESLKHHSPGSCSKRRYDAPAEYCPPCELQADEQSERLELPGAFPVFELQGSPMYAFNDCCLSVPVQEPIKSKVFQWERPSLRSLTPLETPVYCPSISSTGDLLAVPGMTSANPSQESSPISPATPNSATNQYGPVYSAPYVSPITAVPQQTFMESLSHHQSNGNGTYHIEEHARAWNSMSPAAPIAAEQVNIQWSRPSSHPHTLDSSSLDTSYTNSVRQCWRSMHKSPTSLSRAVCQDINWSEYNSGASRGIRRFKSKWHRKLVWAKHSCAVDAFGDGERDTGVAQQDHESNGNEGASQMATIPAELPNHGQSVPWTKFHCHLCESEFTGK